MKITPGRRALDKVYKRRDRYEIPEWQRGEVWDTERKQQLIDSILRGWRLPKFYFVKWDDDEYEVVDGQQRLTAIYELERGGRVLRGNAHYPHCVKPNDQTFQNLTCHALATAWGFRSSGQLEIPSHLACTAGQSTPTHNR